MRQINFKCSRVGWWRQHSGCLRHWHGSRVATPGCSRRARSHGKTVMHHRRARRHLQRRQFVQRLLGRGSATYVIGLVVVVREVFLRSAGRAGAAITRVGITVPCVIIGGGGGGATRVGGTIGLLTRGAGLAGVHCKIRLLARQEYLHGVCMDEMNTDFCIFVECFHLSGLFVYI